MRKFTFLFILFVSSLFVIEGFLGGYIQSLKDQKRREDMKRCVEFTIFPERQSSNFNKPPIVYQVRFEDEFFCPTQPYTVLEALTRTDSVLSTRRKPINLVLKNTPEGVIIESMLDKVNGSSGNWELEVNSNEKINRPLDKVTLQGASYINFYYR